MKSLVFIFSLCAYVLAHAEHIPRDYYIVVSDEFDQEVAPGTCALSGQIMDINNNPVSGGLVSNFDRSRSTYSDAAGLYSLVLSVKDTALFFYHENFGEVVIWKYHFQPQHRVVINFVVAEYSDIPIMEEKPVIYLYADKSTPVNLTLQHSNLTFTYPFYNQGWSVLVNETGGITNQADGKNYPYLFWEGKSTDLAYKSENGQTTGSLICTDSTISFLEHTLAALGLNTIESTDFITYWGPRLMQKKYAFVQFLVNDEVDEHIAGLTVDPMPDHQLRIYLLFTGLDQAQVPFSFEQQYFTDFRRGGLTVVEWGGSELLIRNLIP